MIDGATMTEAGNVAANGGLRAEELASIEQRVRRLEDAVATLQDTRPIEERVVERLRLTAPVASPVAAPAAGSANVLIDVGRRMLPAAMDVIQNEAAAADAQARDGTHATRPGWLLVDMYAEARAMLFMFIDRRYRMSWAGRLVPLVLFAAIITSWIWCPGAWTLSTVIDPLAVVYVKLVDLVLAYFLFKVLAREAARYRAAASGLPPPLR
jgi:hypothetical protein